MYTFRKLNGVKIEIIHSTAPVNFTRPLASCGVSECLSDCAIQIKPIFRNIAAIADSAISDISEILADDHADGGVFYRVTVYALYSGRPRARALRRHPQPQPLDTRRLRHRVDIRVLGSAVRDGRSLFTGRPGTGSADRQRDAAQPGRSRCIVGPCRFTAGTGVGPLSRRAPDRGRGTPPLQSRVSTPSAAPAQCLSVA